MQMRLFLGIYPDARVKDYLQIISQGIKSHNSQAGVKCTEPHNYHITFLFLGNVENDKITELKDQTRNVVAVSPKSYLLFGRVILIPSSKSPRIIAVECLESGGSISDLRNKLISSLEEGGFYPDKKSQKLHMTLGRNKMNKKLYALDFELKKQKIPVDRICLISSILTVLGPIYSVIDKFELN